MAGNPYGDIELTPRAMRALAHPVRLAILSRLQGDGPSTATALAPHVDDPVDRGRSEVRSVAEDDDRSGDFRAQSPQAAAKRCAPAALPLRAVDGRRRARYVVRTEDDERVPDGASAHALEHRLEQHALLRAPEARRGSGGEDDDG